MIVEQVVAVHLVSRSLRAVGVVVVLLWRLEDSR